MMLWLTLGLIGTALALVAAAFVVVPALRWRKGQKRSAFGGLALGTGAFVLAAGLGAYGYLGRPDYALMSLRDGPSPDNFQQAIAYLSQRIRERPNDAQGWTILGRGYLGLGDPYNAEGAFRRAVEIETAQNGDPSGDLLVDYAIARGLATGGIDESVRDIFARAVSIDPENPDARYYYGLALAELGDPQRALAVWDGLLADAPPNAPWRAELPNQIAALRAQAQAPTGEGPPDPRAMVANLAARLSEQPDDIEGWTMLIRAYGVLGETESAHAALENARQVFAGNQAALDRLSEQARESSLE
jgi:cytochrome c-type biogenesis protein CcmH